MVQGIASFMGGSTKEQQLRQQSKEQLLNSKTPIQKRRERRTGLKGGEGADSGIGKFATQLGVGVLPGSGVADVVGVFPDVEGGYEPSMLVNLQQAKRSFQEGNYKQAAAQGIFGALQGLGGASDVALAASPFAPFALPVAVAGKTVSSVGKSLVKKALPKKEKIVYHTTDAKEGIQGEFKTGSDIGFHLGDTESISKNAAIKSEKDLKNLKTEKFKLDADDDEILTISRKGGRFQPDEFADQLLEAKAISEKERKLIGKKMDDFMLKFGENTPEYYSAFNKFYKDLLGKKNIKAIKYFNEYDAGINPIFLETMKKADIDPIQAFQIIAKGDKEKFKQLKDLDLSNTGLDVKPSDSYVVFDDSVIKKISEEKGIESLSVKDSVVNYVQSPSLMSRDELVKSLDSDPTVVEKSIKALKDLGKVNDDNTVTIYRRVPLKKGEELKDETVISGSHDVRAVRDANKALESSTTFDIFGQPKSRGEEVFVKYKVPIDRIKGYLPEVGEYTRGTQARIQRAVEGRMEEKRKQGLGQFTKLKETKRIFEELVNREKEIIADVSGIKPEKLDRNIIYDSSFDDIIEGKVKTGDEYKKANPGITFGETAKIRQALAGGKPVRAGTNEPIEIDESLTINPKTGKRFTYDEFIDYDKQKAQEYVDKIRDDFGLNIKGTETKGIASLPTEQGATKVENMLKPKTEIRSEGGFKLAPEKIKQNVQLQKVRIAKMNEGKTPAGEPLNERIEIKAPEGSNLPNFVVGKIKPKDWQERTEKLLSDEEIERASNWYNEVYDYFKKAPYTKNDEEAKQLARAWFASQQNKSPAAGVAHVLSIRNLLREGKSPEEILAMEKIPAGGLEGANKAILSVLTGREVEGVGPKISDFRDALDGKNVRSFMGNDTIGGQPFVVDVHTGRDTGLVDKPLLNVLEAKGYTIPKNIKLDFGKKQEALQGGGVPSGQYENRSVFGNELTEYLNSVNWKGKNDWEPAQIQAIGWTALTNFYGGVNTAGNIKDALNLNVQRISMEVAPGKGSPWAKMFGEDYSKLSVEDQSKINKEVTNEAIKKISEAENVDLYNNVFGTGGWQTFVNPSTVQEILGSKDQAIRIASKLGYVLNQTEMYVNATKKLTKDPEAYAYDLIEVGSEKLKDSKYVNELFSKIYEKTNGVVVGFHPLLTVDKEPAIRMIVGPDKIKKFYEDNNLIKSRKEDLLKKNNFFENDLKEQIKSVILGEDADFGLNTREADLTVLKNKWNKKGQQNGQNYVRHFSKGRQSGEKDDGFRVLDNIRQELTDFFRQKIRDAQGVKTPNEEVVEIIEDPPPINKKAFGGFVESSNYDHYRII